MVERKLCFQATVEDRQWGCTVPFTKDFFDNTENAAKIFVKQMKSFMAISVAKLLDTTEDRANEILEAGYVN